jgi:hypothetical protein
VAAAVVLAAVVVQELEASQVAVEVNVVVLVAVQVAVQLLPNLV